jgi:hypothetical protein
MRLFQGFFSRALAGGDHHPNRNSSRRRRSHRLSFERLEDRKVLDAESFDIIGWNDYIGNPTLSQYDGTGYAIAVLDTGAFMDHEIFGPDVNPADGVPDRIVYQYDYIEDDGSADDEGFAFHGTAMAGIIAEMAPGADLIILKVLDSEGNQDDPTKIEAALNWINQNRMIYNIVAVNMSWGEGNFTSPETSQAIHNELAALANNKVALIACSGNDFVLENHIFDATPTPGVWYPAADPGVISVGATWDGDWADGDEYPFPENEAVDITQDVDRIAAFGQRHEDLLDVFAPGASITVASLGASNSYADREGTSLSAAHVTAAVALAHQLNDVFGFDADGLDKDELVDLMQETGVEVEDGDDENDNVVNTGITYKRLNFEAMGYKLFKPNAPDLTNTSDWGFSETDDITADLTPTFTGSAPLGSHVWLYVDGVEKANGAVDGSGNYSLTSTTLGADDWSVTIKVAADSSVTDNRSQTSTALTITIVASEELDPVTSTFDARLSETLVVEGANTGTSEFLINWGTSPQRQLTKTGAGTVTISEVTDPSQTVTYLANAGTTIFTTDTGVSGIPGTSTRVANWTVEAEGNVDFTTSQNLAGLSVGAAGFVTVTTATPPNYKVLYVDELSFTEVGGVPTGTLDLKNNGMVIEFATTTAARNNETNLLRDWLIEGRGGMGVGNGTWDGTGITSSTAEAWNAGQAEQRSIGYVVNADLAALVHGEYTTFLGHTVDSSCTLLRYTVTCDTDLNGTVNEDDITVLGTQYNPSEQNPHWTHGDADYNWFVDDDDVTLFGAMNGLSLES